MRKSHGKVRDGGCFMLECPLFEYEHADFLKFSLNGQAVPSGGVSRAEGEASDTKLTQRQAMDVGDIPGDQLSIYEEDTDGRSVHSRPAAEFAHIYFGPAT